MKTRRQHLQENLTQEEFNKVLSVLDSYQQKELILETECEKNAALVNAFDWTNTEDGFAYWSGINYDKFFN